MEIKGPFVIAITGTMPGAPQSELVETLDGFKTLKKAEEHNYTLSYPGDPMSIEDWRIEFWGDSSDHIDAIMKQF